MKTDSAYRKFIYWLAPGRSGETIGELLKSKKRIHNAKHHPCEALYPRRDLALVGPGTWDLRCRRQGSWYRASQRSGWSLLVSNTPLDDLPLWGTLTLEAFEPPRTATDRDVMEMISDPRTPELLPLEWGIFSPWERQAIHEFLLQEDMDRSLQEVFCYYTANHLNFVFPRFFVSREGHAVVPYSIHKTAMVCSACVELFGVLGDAYPLKYLVPCPGLKYLTPPAGHWIRVERAARDRAASSPLPAG
jgi:hypothetical protein